MLELRIKVTESSDVIRVSVKRIENVLHKNIVFRITLFYIYFFFTYIK